MSKRFWLSFVVLFVVSMALDFLIHGWHLHAIYQSMPALYRSDADSQQYMGWMFLAHALIAYAFVWIAVMVYVWSIWRRMNKVEDEMRALAQKLPHR